MPSDRRPHRTVRTLGWLLALCLAGFGAVTFWALESGEVVVVRTRGTDGTERSTRVWSVRDAGWLWLEAGTPRNAWFLDVQREPVLTLEEAGASARYRAHPERHPAVHERIRRRIRAKYGLRDRWVGWMLVDPSQSVMVRLEPLDAP